MLRLTQQELLNWLDHEGSPPIPPGTEIGDISLTGHQFLRPIDLSGVRFCGGVQLEKCLFAEGARFVGARFAAGATFYNCTFCGEADFSWSIFTGKAYFWRSRFLGTASFWQFRTESADKRDESTVYPGEANYSWARFEGDVSFHRAQFGGKAYFYRTIFKGNAGFDEAHFSDAVWFYGGAPWEVCVTQDDIGGPAIYQRLVTARVLTTDPETTDGRYAHFEDVTSAEALRRRLGEVGLTSEEMQAVEAGWRQEALPTFPCDHQIHFRAVELSRSTGSRMERVDMRQCLLSGTNVDQMTFADVRWPLGWQLFRLGRRLIVADEKETRTAHEFVALSRLYSLLGKNCEGERDFQEASDFYYGEMEARRRATPLPWRILSIPATYKYLSDYGENYALALMWLVVMVLAIFPLLYYLIGPYQSVSLAILHSLRVSTFLPGMNETTPVRSQFVEGIERIAVTLQATLTTLAIRRRFARK